MSAETKEVTDVEYDGNLEFFVEKTLAERFVVRLAAQNLLDAEKDEIERVYESVDQLAGQHAGHDRSTRSRNRTRSYILTFRGTF